MKKPTAVGELRHSITIEQAVDTPDGSGGSTRTWQTFCTALADIKPTSGRERFFAGKLESNTTHKIFMRYRSGITSSMRVNSTVGTDVLILQIHGVINVDHRERWLTLLCEEGVGS